MIISSITKAKSADLSVALALDEVLECNGILESLTTQHTKKHFVTTFHYFKPSHFE